MKVSKMLKDLTNFDQHENFEVGKIDEISKVSEPPVFENETFEVDKNDELPKVSESPIFKDVKCCTFSDYTGTPSIEQIVQHEIVEKALEFSAIKDLISSGNYILNLYIEISEQIKNRLSSVWETNVEYLESIFGKEFIDKMNHFESPLTAHSVEMNIGDTKCNATLVFYRKNIAKRILDDTMASFELYAMKKGSSLIDEDIPLAYTTFKVAKNQKDWTIKTDVNNPKFTFQSF